MPPTVIRLDTIEDLKREWFGPVLHVATWKAGELSETIARVNASGYGLTMGLHSRIARVGGRGGALAAVGNLYVNRSMIGAVVGSQPFGGEGLSGTGPKAGGPHYLHALLRRARDLDRHDLGGRQRHAAVARRGGRRDLTGHAAAGLWAGRRVQACANLIAAGACRGRDRRI